MEINQLPVYNKTRRLFLQFVISTRKTPVDIKQGIINDTKQSLIRILRSISFANEEVSNTECRAGFIKEAIDAMKTVKINVRIIYDLHYIKKSGFSSIIELEEDVSRQLAGWYNTTIKTNN